jgi:hypothetical protein
MQQLSDKLRTGSRGRVGPLVDDNAVGAVNCGRRAPWSLRPIGRRERESSDTRGEHCLDPQRVLDEPVAVTVELVRRVVDTA